MERERWRDRELSNTVHSTHSLLLLRCNVIDSVQVRVLDARFWGPALRRSVCAPSGRREEPFGGGQSTHLLVSGGVRGASRYLHHDALSTLSTR